jgi:hypothetical protein
VNYYQLSTAIQDYTQNFEQTFIDNIPVFVQQTETRIYNTVLIPALRKNVTGVTTGGNKYLSCPADFLSVLSMAVIDANDNFEYLLNKDVNFIRAAYPNAGAQDIPKYYSLFGPTVTTPSITFPSGITNELSFILGPTPDDAYDVELHYYYYPATIVPGVITTISIAAAGDSYIDGVYNNVPLIYDNSVGGTSQARNGTGVQATITISGGAVTGVVITNGGINYEVGDPLTFTGSFTGGSGAFYLFVTGVSTTTGNSWVGDNYDPVLLYGSLVEAYTFMKGEQDMMAYYQQKYQEALQQLIRLGGALERGDAYRDGQYKGKAAP